MKLPGDGMIWYFIITSTVRGLCQSSSQVLLGLIIWLGCIDINARNWCQGTGFLNKKMNSEAEEVEGWVDHVLMVYENHLIKNKWFLFYHSRLSFFLFRNIIGLNWRAKDCGYSYLFCTPEYILCIICFELEWDRIPGIQGYRNFLEMLILHLLQYK